jgi:hypothetical protein
MSPPTYSSAPTSSPNPSTTSSAPSPTFPSRAHMPHRDSATTTASDTGGIGYLSPPLGRDSVLAPSIIQRDSSYASEIGEVGDRASWGSGALVSLRARWWPVVLTETNSLLLFLLLFFPSFAWPALTTNHQPLSIRSRSPRSISSLTLTKRLDLFQRIRDRSLFLLFRRSRTGTRYPLHIHLQPPNPPCFPIYVVSQPKRERDDAGRYVVGREGQAEVVSEVRSGRSWRW